MIRNSKQNLAQLLINEENNKIVLRTRDQTKYLVLDVYKKELLNVHKGDFLRRDLPCFIYKDYVVKFKGKRSLALQMIQQSYAVIKFNAEALPTLQGVKDAFSDFFEGVGTIFSMISGIGRVGRNVNQKYDDFIQNFVNPSKSILDKGYHIYGLKLAKVMSSIYSLIKVGTFQIMDFVPVILDVLDLSSTAYNDGLFKPESLDMILLAGVSSILPSKVMQALKNLQLLSGRKMFDDSGILLDFLGGFSRLIDSVIEMMPIKVRDYLNQLFGVFGLNEYIYIQRAKVLLVAWDKDKKIIFTNKFRNDVKVLSQELKDMDIKRFFGRNKILSDLTGDFERLVKGVTSYEQTSRSEPCCFVFEGPPGCRKSVTMNKVVQTLGLSHYAHIVKCAEDGKDWYDSYNSESVFFMDDVGQMGKSQWRSIINWVSSVKLPLDCAEAKLKDTKYFNSDIILLTTNRFQTLSGFTAKDCIDDPEALWRRGYVFDFAHVKGVGAGLQGYVEFKFYNILTKTFEVAFPADFLDFLSLNDVQLEPQCRAEDQQQLLVWINTIIMGFKKLKITQQDNNDLTTSAIDSVRKANPFASEGGSLSVLGDLFIEYSNFCLSTAIDLFSDMVQAIWNNPLMVSIGAGFISVILAFMYKVKSTIEVNQEGATVKLLSYDDSLAKYDSFNLDEVHTLLPKVASQVFKVSAYCTSKEGRVMEQYCYGIVSERLVIVPLHIVLDHKVQLTIYKDKDSDHRLIDHCPVRLVYGNIDNDVAILALCDGFPTPFSKIAHCFKYSPDRCVGLVFPKQVIKLQGLLSPNTVSGPVVYPIGIFENEILDPLVYKLHFAGMCGVPLITERGAIKGMHIAGEDNIDVGVAMIWSEDVREEIFKHLDNRDFGLKINTVISDKTIPNSSAIKIKTDMAKHTPKMSSIVPSPLYNLFENTRIPANLSVYGNHTVKDIAKGSRVPIGPVCEEELSFAFKVMGQYFEDFGDLTEREIVLGDEELARINKKSSNGIFPMKNKEDCFDYETGTFKQEFRTLYDKFEDKMSTGDIDPQDIAWFETLKDELRNVEKKEPRSFRVSPISVQVLTKKCFGNMVKKIVKDRWFNEIMIGINPFQDWKKLYSLISAGRSWGGDIGKYDKKMCVQVQIMVAELILKFYKGQNKQAARNVLLNIAFSLVVVNDDCYVTTHSLPSGSWLTAIFNSLVNRAYTVMWYYREMKKNGHTPEWNNFHKDLSDPVYGDDRINCCKKEKYASFLNAITMRQFFESIGMEMTDSMKGVVTTPFQPISEITFLKRYFTFHPGLREITCPLDLRTTYSTLSWMDGSKEDLEGILQDKINCFQREIFLHYHIYEHDVDVLEDYCTKSSIKFVRLPFHYLKNLYLDNLYEYEYGSAFGILNSVD